MSVSGTTLVWLRRDLRLTDNPALHAACEGSARVLAVYIHAPDEERPWVPGAGLVLRKTLIHSSICFLNSSLSMKPSISMAPKKWADPGWSTRPTVAIHGLGSVNSYV